MFSFDHIALSVRNIEESVNFYKLFGFTKINEWKSQDSTLHMVMLINKNNEQIELVFCSGSEPLPDSQKVLDSDLKHIGIKHLALQVDSIDETIIFLKNHNYNYDNFPIMGKLGRRYFFINDPNGILLEFIEKP